MPVSEKSAKTSGQNSTFECLEVEKITSEKKRKKKEKKRLYKLKMRAIEGPHVSGTGSFFSPAIQADYLEKKVREVYMDYSSLELEDLRISGISILRIAFSVVLFLFFRRKILF